MTMNLKPSLLRNLSLSFLAFGVAVGFIFPFYAEFFVDWKPGMYPWFFVGCLVAGASIGIANYWLTKIILLRKLQRIADVARAISDKDISHDCKLESHDLIGEIVGSFNQMAETLRSMIGKIDGQATQLQTASESLKHLSAEATEESHRQQNDIEQVTNAMQQMTGTVQEMAQHSQESANATREADEHGENAKVVVVEAMSSVDVLADMVGDASEVIANLEAESENIGNVLAVINGIAEQTNLLALNAAIEAARAGDQGRGFAVVADEVRTLATRTQQSTEEISAMIERLQSGSRKAVTTMKEGHDQAQKGVEYTEQAAEALAVIAGNINAIKDMSIHIATAADQQNTAVDDVNRNITAINSASVQTTEHLHQLNDSSEDVARLAAGLHELVSGYKV